MKIKTVLKDVPDQDGRHLIFIHVAKDSKRIKISTGIKVHPSSWEREKEKDKEKFKEIGIIKQGKFEPKLQARQKADKLNSIIALLKKIEADYNFLQSEFSLEDLKEKYNNYGKEEVREEQVPEGDLSVFSNLVEAYKEKYRNMRKPRTLGRFKQVQDALEEFRPGLRITDIDYNFLIGYCDFLIGKGFQNATIKHNHLKAIKIIGKEAVRVGIKVSSDIEQFTWKAASKKPFAATWEEVQKIAAIPDKELTLAQRQIRDAFLVTCYTGLRDSDLRLINKANISTQKGMKVLRINSQKTDFDYNIPLSGKVLEILEKYGFKMPLYSQQHHNREIKIVAKKVIKEVYYQKVTMQGNKKTVDYVARGEMFSTHTGRRTFGRRFLDRGGSLVILSKIFGHSSIEVTMKYIGYDQQEVMDEFFKVMGDD